MSAEIEHFKSLRNNGDETLEKTAVAFPMQIAHIDFFGPGNEVLVSCGPDNMSSMVMVNPKNIDLIANIQATIYRDSEDLDGVDVSLVGGRIKIENPQELCLVYQRPSRSYSHRVFPTRSLEIYFSSDSESSQDQLPGESRPLILA